MILGSVMLYMRLNIFHLLRYLREELLLLGTSTAEPALPGLMRKLEHAGVEKPTVGLVVPTGYSFNLDGAAIYLSLAALYIAQATNTDLTIPQQLGLLGVMLLTSKGAAGVAGGGFIALTATLASVGSIPAAGIMLVFGIDKFMSECRAQVTSAATPSPRSSSPIGTRASTSTEPAGCSAEMTFRRCTRSTRSPPRWSPTTAPAARSLRSTPAPRTATPRPP